MTPAKTDLPLGKGITAFSTLRDTDSPDQPYSGFNACHYTGDTPSHVDQCRSALCHTLSINPERLIIPTQTHSDNVTVIDSIPVAPETIDNTDALVTGIPGVALCINTADCAPILMADPEAGVIAAVHSGWRGTVQKITGKTVRKMIELGADANRIKVAAGPMICNDCFEVGPEVAEEFERIFPQGGTVDYSRIKPHIDLFKAITITLTDSGIKKCNISPPVACSRCSYRNYFSARRMGTLSGRTLSAIICRGADGGQKRR